MQFGTAVLIHFLRSRMCEVHLLVHQPPIGIWSCCTHPTSTPTSGALDPTILDKYFETGTTLYLSLTLSCFGQVMSPHHFDQMSQRSQVSRIALWRCSLNVFVFVIVNVFVIVFVIVFLLVRSCLLITLIKCLKGHKSLGSLCSVVKTLIVSGAIPTGGWTRSPIQLLWTAKNVTEKPILWN